ncbi:MAG: hypothetical protein ABL886_05550, partial [Rhodoglobus sp.]
IPKATWKNEKELRDALTKALQGRKKTEYAFNISTGKLTLKTKVKGVDISGEIDVASIAKRLAIAGGAYLVADGCTDSAKPKTK